MTVRMHVTCPNCSHAVEYSTERPRFCSFCGQSLVNSVDDQPTRLSPPSDALTGDFHPAETHTVVPAAAAAAQVPEQIGGYRLVRRLGGGGMGSVYQAEHIASGQKVALKLIKPDFARSPQAVDRFRQEGRLASAIIHPRCVFVLAADEEAGQPYIVMELMPGNTLSDLVETGGPLPYAEAVKKILDVISGLQEAHRLDVIHRDVKPSNCFLEIGGRVKVGDFGLAKSVALDDQLTRTGAFLGTPLFSSPEQIKRQPVTLQTDVYSVSATLYFLLTGKAPFASGGDAMAAVARIVSENVPPPRSLNPDIPKSLEKIVLRGLERDPARRWTDLEAMRRALRPFSPGQLTFGGLAVRLAAYLIDLLVVSVLTFVTMFTMRSSVIRLENPNQIYENLNVRTIESLLVGTALHLLYFGVMDGILGWTIGKRMARLRVCTPNGVDPPGLLRGAGRTLVLHEVMNIGAWLLIVILAVFRPQGNWADGLSPKEAVTAGLLGLLPSVGVIVGSILLLATMRKRNGYRGLHEFLSGTRVVQLPAPPRIRSYLVPDYRMETSRPPGMPERIGPFVVREAVQWTDAEKTLIAEDESLRRTMWIWLRPRTDPAVKPRRRDMTRATRLRWVTGGAHEDQRWEAYLAPRGIPLPVVVAAHGRFSWADALPILDQLSEELATACRERTAPQTLNVHQVLLDTAGRIQLLGIQLDSVESEDVPLPEAEGRSDTERSLSLIAQTAALLLEGKPRTAEELNRPLQAPLPGSAVEPLNRLFNKRDPHSGPAAFRTALAKLRESPTEVPRARRFLHAAAVAIVALILVVPVLSIPIFGSLLLPTNRALESELFADELEHLTRNLALGTVSPNPNPFGRAAAAVQYQEDARTVSRLRQIQDHDRRLSAERDKWTIGGFREMGPQKEEVMRASLKNRPPDYDLRGSAEAHARSSDRVPVIPPMFSLIALAVIALMWMIWASLWRGGFVLRLVDLAVVRNDGLKASRLQCAWRAFLFWLPIVLLFGTSVWLDSTYWANWDSPLRRLGWRWMLWWSWLLWWAGLLLPPVYLTLALWKPDRAPHDRLAGTWLVPR